MRKNDLERTHIFGKLVQYGHLFADGRTTCEYFYLDIWKGHRVPAVSLLH